MKAGERDSRKAGKSSESVRAPAEEERTPHFLQSNSEWSPGKQLRIEETANPQRDKTLGDVGLAVRVSGHSEDRFPPTILIQPYDPRHMVGIDEGSIRVFHFEGERSQPRLVEASGINVGFHFVWSIITRPGTYAAIGLARDRLVQQVLRNLVQARRGAESAAPNEVKELTRSALALFLETPDENLEELRARLAHLEIQTGLGTVSRNEIRVGKGGHTLPFALPQTMSLKEFKERLSKIRITEGSMPEEALLRMPNIFETGGPPWPIPFQSSWIEKLLWPIPIMRPPWWPWPLPCWFFSQDWWMYHANAEHSGNASGCSGINRTTAGWLHLWSKTPVDGAIVTIPTIVQGKVYVGTRNSPGGGGTLYKIDLVSGNIELTFDTPLGYGYIPGIGGSPAVVDSRVYFTACPGRVYCLDANTFAVQWTTDIRNADPAHNQPVQNPNADTWSSPLVVNGRVYVGCGEGEGNAWGFVYCLDATTGNVIWLFCTNQFVAGVDNNPNTIPTSAVGIFPLPAGFVSQADPQHRGASVWSSPAYDMTLRRIFVGTGNSADPLPDARYGSGVIALDADSGQFRRFFQPDLATSYRPTDSDVDMPSSPMLYTEGGRRVLAIGSKNGSFFLLDADTLVPITPPRQLLPRFKGDGFEGDASTPIGTVDTGGGENHSGIFGTAAVHYELGRLFVGLGGYGNQSSIDTPTTPFMRVLDWSTLNDTWFLQDPGDGIRRYTTPSPPMYTNLGEAGLSSPAIVNDVVFCSTSNSALYAFDAATGLCLWKAPGIVGGPADSIMGPAIYGDFVVIGAPDGNVYIYSLWFRLPWPFPPPWWWRRIPFPPPPWP